MILTGNAKKNFLMWSKNQKKLTITISNNYDYHLIKLYSNVEKLPSRLINSLIIDWLDSIGIYIEIGGVKIDGVEEFWYNIQEINTLNGVNLEKFNTRIQATYKAIERINKYYNKLKKEPENNYFSEEYYKKKTIIDFYEKNKNENTIEQNVIYLKHQNRYFTKKFIRETILEHIN